MDRSLKLKLLPPNPGNDGYEVGSARKQCPKSTDGGCMAANGDECSILRPNCTLGRVSEVIQLGVNQCR